MKRNHCKKDSFTIFHWVIFILLCLVTVYMFYTAICMIFYQRSNMGMVLLFLSINGTIYRLKTLFHLLKRKKGGE